jgi:hypothetical protein
MMTKKMKLPGWPNPFAPPVPGLSESASSDVLTRSMTGGFDFVKMLWGGLPSSVPGMVVPTIDVEELDKRITDLKAVESWLEVNAGMLRATIQALEVQRNTVATLKTLGGSFGESASDILQGMSRFAASATTPVAPVTPPSEAAPPRRKPRTAPVKSTAKSEAPAAPAAAASGAAWLDFLQNQFNQVAMAALQVPNAAPKASAPAKAPIAKSRARGRSTRG